MERYIEVIKCALIDVNEIKLRLVDKTSKPYGNVLKNNWYTRFFIDISNPPEFAAYIDDWKEEDLYGKKIITIAGTSLFIQQAELDYFHRFLEARKNNTIPVIVDDIKKKWEKVKSEFPSELKVKDLRFSSRGGRCCCCGKMHYIITINSMIKAKEALGDLNDLLEKKNVDDFNKKYN